MSSIKKTFKLSFPWQTQDPFLFSVHHEDFYPAGKEDFSPDTSLAGRNLGNDFVVKDGFRMYHGKTVPGFPAHPHRGFETVTVVRTGLIDHSDSMGAYGRFGFGDVQWMTAGKGVQHSEMFPLLNREEDNPLELFQIWLNLPKKSKMVEPHYKMLWSEEIPRLNFEDENGKKTYLELIAGTLDGHVAVHPTPNSWAADPENEVGIWYFDMEPGAKWSLPASKGTINRTLYFFEGDEAGVDGRPIKPYHGVELDSRSETLVVNGNARGRFVVLQGKPISEPVVHYGPFVMNSEAEIRQTMYEYQTTQFGGWPWDSNFPVHGPEKKRFAKYADGTEESRG